MKEKIIVAVIMAAMTVSVALAFRFTVTAIAVSVDKSEIHECAKLEKYSKQYPGFFLAQWQADMCEAHGIEIAAPIK